MQDKINDRYSETAAQLAEDPEILASDHRGGHPQCLMGTQEVADLDVHLKKIREIVYHAGE